jgi:hypothetical protein
MTNVTSTARKAAAILSPKKHIFLLSHMRSYTSLIGHIMGSNPEICGYYEMHIGYHSWRSLIRQKLLYFKQEAVKPQFSYMFDKVLHNDHKLSLAVLRGKQTKAIFCLRHPRQVIPSILKLYQCVDPTHEINSELVATEYYIQRLRMLEQLAGSLQQAYFYLDAEALKSDTDDCLNLLSEWLNLKNRLASNYELQRHTSINRFGDPSEQLKTGRILNESSSYAEFRHNEVLHSRALQAYETARTQLIQSSSRRCVIQTLAYS